MKISELSKRTGVSAHRLRRYQELGLIRAGRGPSGYREFAETVIREVVFIAMSRDLGFSLKDIGETLPSYRAKTLGFDQMIDIMQGRKVEIDRQIAVLHAIRKKLLSHVAWLKTRKREYAKRKPSDSPPSWPSTKKSPK